MSGRPYARNLRAPFAGATDLEAVLPHTFRVSAARTTSSAKERAIRNAIRRRCMEKNWKKMFSLRHSRLSRQQEGAQEPAGGADAAESEAAAPGADDNGTLTAEEAPQAGEKSEEKEEEGEEEAVAAAKRQLEELKQKLQALTDQKHGKFLLLKQILVQEARSKTSGPPAGGAAKKRRLDDAGGFSPLSSAGAGVEPAGAASNGNASGSQSGPASTSAAPSASG